jgi:hypothetical protein
VAPELVWAQRLQEKSFAPAGDPTPIAQSVVRHYTDLATLAPKNSDRRVKCFILSIIKNIKFMPMLTF